MKILYLIFDDLHNGVVKCILLAFIKKTQTRVYGIPTRHDSTISYFIFNNNKIVQKKSLKTPKHCMSSTAAIYK